MNLRRHWHVIILVRFSVTVIATAITTTTATYRSGCIGDIAYTIASTATVSTIGKGSKGKPPATALASTFSSARASTLASTPMSSSAPASALADIHAT